MRAGMGGFIQTKSWSFASFSILQLYHVYHSLICSFKSLKNGQKRQIFYLLHYFSWPQGSFNIVRGLNSLNIP